MSLRGRHVIDRMKQAVSGYLTMPVPPYQNPSYWEGVYRRLGPDDVFEWGGLSCSDFLKYQYRLCGHKALGISPKEQGSTRETTLGETLGAYPCSAQDEPIMMLGCGNSKFGEDMVKAGWKGPLIQVDIASRVIESMRHRCDDTTTATPAIQCVQDDATLLSAFNDDKLNAVFDKGLVDALFCANAYDQCYDVMSAVHRVLRPESCFAVLSFSRPEFLLEKLLVPPPLQQQKRRSNVWGDVQIRELDNILLYRFQKDGQRDRPTSSRKRRQ